MEDPKLLRLLHKDPNAGMERLMDQYAGLVYAVVKGRLAESPRVSSDIEDCVADVFSQFYTHLSDYDPNRSSIKTYLCAMARNQASSVARRRGRDQGTVSLDDEASVLQLADDALIDNALAEEELRRKVFEAVKSLGEPDASILMRKYYFGESSKEIADALGLSVSNVDTRTHRALHKLKSIFGEESI